MAEYYLADEFALGELARARTARAPISRLSARERGRCSCAAARRPGEDRTLPRFAVAAASPSRYPNSRLTARYRSMYSFASARRPSARRTLHRFPVAMA